jgi:hypothetical protein
VGASRSNLDLTEAAASATSPFTRFGIRLYDVLLATILLRCSQLQDVWMIKSSEMLSIGAGQSRGYRRTARQQARASIMQNEVRKLSLQKSPDEAILRLARVLGRQAAREDHEKEHSRRNKEESSDLCSILDRSSE